MSADATCHYRYANGHKCSSVETEHVHQTLPKCPNADRHHEYVAPRPHEHEFNRCVCGEVYAALAKEPTDG